MSSCRPIPRLLHARFAACRLKPRFSRLRSTFAPDILFRPAGGSDSGQPALLPPGRKRRPIPQQVPALPGCQQHRPQAVGSHASFQAAGNILPGKFLSSIPQSQQFPDRASTPPAQPFSAGGLTCFQSALPGKHPVSNFCFYDLTVNHFLLPHRLLPPTTGRLYASRIFLSISAARSAFSFKTAWHFPGPAPGGYPVRKPGAAFGQSDHSRNPVKSFPGYAFSVDNIEISSGLKEEQLYFHHFGPRAVAYRFGALF